MRQAPSRAAFPPRRVTTTMHTTTRSSPIRTFRRSIAHAEARVALARASPSVEEAHTRCIAVARARASEPVLALPSEPASHAARGHTACASAPRAAQRDRSYGGEHARGVGAWARGAARAEH
ncbi:hypothetical protein A0H81_05996 [Grifola frondosa]|uniref:Uncharacterized protein n=1 Tax=Grifola frondosa TaxID=5627 RepID=A0A1C7M9L5_GRIFR|nr:hypothetical protein A0H81_05996 [Grifola frondosa]